MKKHLAIVHPLALRAILNGNKSVETRFSKHQIAPYKLISTGDLVYLKSPGKDISGQFRVKKVFFFEGLESKDVKQIFDQYDIEISFGDKFFDDSYKKSKRDASYATLIFIKESERFITSPVRIKKTDQRGWVVLE